MTMSSTQPKICPTCDRPLASDEPCPACLWSSVFAEDKVVEEGARELPLDVPGHAVLDEIARGGMGIVYRAREIEAGREVALKMLLPFQSASEGMRERFRTEARAAAMLDHPHVLPVFQVGETAEWLYFTMKLAEGGTLAQRVEKFSGDWKAISQLVAQLADAVDFAHSRGVLHRDLKPGNVLFDKAGTPFVADFGLAKLMSGESDEMALLTRTNAVLGTPHYLSPEVADRGAAEATVASDLYGLGAILYQLLTGGPPFRGESLTGLMAAIANTPPKPPRSIDAKVPRDLETICLKCLEKEPARRYGRVAELAADLRRWSDGQAIVARKVSPAERFWLLAKRHPWASLAAVLLLGLCVGLALQTASALQSGREAIAANERAEEELWNSRLQRARALRLSTQAGVRGQALAAIEEAARFRPSAELRTEAIAVLATSDWGDERHAFSGVGEDWTKMTPDLDHAAVFTTPDKRTIAVRRVADGASVAEFVARDHPFHAFELRPDAGAVLASVWTNRLELWQVGSKQPLWRLETAEELHPGCFGWLPDGRIFLLQQVAGRRILDPETGKLLDTQLRWGRSPKDPSPAFDREQTKAAMITRHYEMVELVDWPNLRRRADPFELAKRDRGIKELALCPDGRQIAAGFMNGRLVVVDTLSRRERSLPAQDNPVWHVMFDTDRRWLVTHYWRGVTRVWDAASLSLQFEIPDREPVAFSADGKQIALRDRPGNVSIRELEPSPVFRQFREASIGDFQDAAISPDGEWLVISGYDGASSWRLRTGEPGDRMAGKFTSRASFDRDGDCFVLARDALLKWKAQEVETSPLSGDPEVALDLSAQLPNSGGMANGRWSLVGGQRSEVVTADGSEPGREILHTNGHGLVGRNRIFSDFSQDGHWFTVYSFKGDGVWVADAETCQLKKHLINANTATCFSPDSKTLAISSDLGLALWDTTTWEIRRELTELEHPWSNGNLAYSPDGNWLALAGSTFIQLLDADSLEEIVRLTPPDPQTVMTLDFSPDGSLLVAGGQGHNVMVWDIAELRKRLAAMRLDW